MNTDNASRIPTCWPTPVARYYIRHAKFPSYLGRRVLVTPEGQYIGIQWDSGSITTNDSKTYQFS